MLCEVVNIRGKDDQRFGPDLRDFTQQSYLLYTQKTSKSDRLTRPHLSERAYFILRKLQICLFHCNET